MACFTPTTYSVSRSLSLMTGRWLANTFSTRRVDAIKPFTPHSEISVIATFSSKLVSEFKSSRAWNSRLKRQPNSGKSLVWMRLVVGQPHRRLTVSSADLSFCFSTPYHVPLWKRLLSWGSGPRTSRKVLRIVIAWPISMPIMWGSQWQEDGLSGVRTDQRPAFWCHQIRTKLRTTTMLAFLVIFCGFSSDTMLNWDSADLTCNP